MTEAELAVLAADRERHAAAREAHRQARANAEANFGAIAMRLVHLDANLRALDWRFRNAGVREINPRPFSACVTQDLAYDRPHNSDQRAVLAASGPRASGRSVPASNPPAAALLEPAAFLCP